MDEVDSQVTFDALRSIMSAQGERIRDRFEVERDPAYGDLAAYGPKEGWRGELSTSSGPEIDWMTHSWMGDPSSGFTHMALACWLGPRVAVPHLWLAWGTLPALWFHLDYLPRVDLQVDGEYLERYFGPTNDRFLELKSDDGLSYFTSRDLEVRQQVSQTAFRFVCTDADVSGSRTERIDQVGRLAEQRVTDWISMVDDAAPVPDDQRGALAERDLAVRRLIAETDPANVLGGRYLGEELAGRVLGALWGAERDSRRPGS